MRKRKKEWKRKTAGERMKTMKKKESKREIEGETKNRMIMWNDVCF